MAEPVPVETKTLDGQLVPYAFHWQEKRRAILDWGRQWSDEEGHRHYLVRTSRQRVFELEYQPRTGRWQLTRSPRDFDGGQQAV